MKPWTVRKYYHFGFVETDTTFFVIYNHFGQRDNRLESFKIVTMIIIVFEPWWFFIQSIKWISNDLSEYKIEWMRIFR